MTETASRYHPALGQRRTQQEVTLPPKVDESRYLSRLAYLPERPFLGPDAHKQHACIQEGEDARRDPGSEHQWCREDLQHDGEVVRVWQEFVRSAPDEGRSWQDHNACGPTFAKAQDGPVTQGLSS